MKIPHVARPPDSEALDKLDARVKRLSSMTQAAILRGALFTELELMLRGAPADKRSDFLRMFAWCWDNMPAENWKATHVRSTDEALHTIVTYYRENCKNVRT